MAKRVGIKEGTKINNTIFEICYKNDEYGDPLIMIIMQWQWDL